MKLYRDLNQHRFVRGAVKLLNGISGHSAAGAEETEARKAFRTAFYDEVLQHNEKWQPLAISITNALPDPLANGEVLAYGSALRRAAHKFQYTYESPPEQFLTENERRLCELDVLLGDAIADVRRQAGAFATDMKLDANADGGAHESEPVYQALRVLALYRCARAEQRDRLFELLGYTYETQVEIIANLVEYMERGFSRAESLEYLRRRGGVPAGLAQRALAAHVVTEGFASSESDARAFAGVLRELHVPDETIAAAWAAAGLESAPIENALAEL